MSHLQDTPDPSLKTKSVRGGLITMSAQAATVIIQLSSIILLSRLLSPKDFGVIAMITAITAFMGLFRDMGLSTASIQKGVLTFEQTTALFWLNTAAGTFLMLLVIVLAPAIAWFYNDDELVSVTRLLAVTFLISSLGAQHSALMQRELRFKPKAIADISGAALTLLISALLATRDFGYWAIAWGVVAGSLATTALYSYFSNFRPGLPRRTSGIRELVGFGADVTAFEIANYFHRNLDNILIGRVWGASALGLYSRAYQMMMLPIISLRTPINAIAFPVLSRLRDSPAEFKRYYRKITSLLALLSMPLMMFLALKAKPVVEIALGPEWSEVTPIFFYLGLAGFIQPVASLRGLVLLSIGSSRRYLAWGLLNTLVMSAAFLAGIRWGAEGVAAAYAAANYLILYPSMAFAFHGTSLRALDFFEAILLPVGASCLAGLACYSVSNLFMISSAVAEVLISALVFSSVFALVYLITQSGRATICFYVSLLRTLKN